MLTLIPKDITIGVIFSSKRDSALEKFFKSAFHDRKVLFCHFLIVDNACTFSLKERVEVWFAEHAPLHPPEFRKYIRNEKIESLPYNHNLIYFNAETDYIIHNNDEVWLKENWLTGLMDWHRENDGDNHIAHLCRCSKGYHKSIIKKMGYFNLLLPAKDASDSDIEYREYVYIDGNEITVDQWRGIGDSIVISRMIGGVWRYLPYFEPFGCCAYEAGLCLQPGDPDYNLGDSNQWMRNDPNLSERNKHNVDPWPLVGKQGLEDISHLFNSQDS